MSLINCKECKAKISDKAFACPKCGCPLIKNDNQTKFIAAKCPCCGANINVNKDETKTTCDYCHTNIIVEDAINKLKIELSGEIEVKNIPKFNSLMINGNRYFDNREWAEAYREYNKAVELEPYNYVAVLRNGICNSLNTNYNDFNLNPLSGGIKGALKILGENASDEDYNKIAKEGFDAIKILENFVNSFYHEGLCDYKGLLDNQQKLLGCMSLYILVESIAKNIELKKEILLEQIFLAESLIVSKKYRTGVYSSNGNELIKKYIPNKSFERELYSYRNAAAEKYNKLVSPNEAMKIKKQPYVRTKTNFLKIFIFISLVSMLFSAVSSIFENIDKDITKYDYVQDCSGLQNIKLSDIYYEYQNDKELTRDKYINKAFIFEGKIFRIDNDRTMLQIDSEEISPEIYINPSESIKLKDYESGDMIKMCGIIKDKNTIISVPIYVENATIIEK